MGFDRNTILGFVLMGLLLFGYIFFNSKQQNAYLKEKQRVEDSIAKITLKKTRTLDPVTDSLRADSVARVAAAGTAFPEAGKGTEQLTVVENDLVKITFTNRGGQPKSVELKKYKRYNGQPLVMVAPGNQVFSYAIQTGPNQAAQTSELSFSGGTVTKNGDLQVIRYQLSNGSQSVTHEYVLKPSDYMVMLNININGAQQLLQQNMLNGIWQFTEDQQEKDIKYEKGQADIGYVEKDSYDFSRIGTSTGEKKLEDVRWIGFKQQFFNNTLVSKDYKMQTASIDWKVPADSLHKVVVANAYFQIKLPATGGNVTLPFQWYVGPNDYHILKAYDLQLENHVQLGSGVFTFVKYLNRWIVIPVFDFFHRFVGSFGLVILFLTLFIRLVISPLTYTSYLSGAKMRVLRPEIDELKAKYKDNQQAFGVEQMSLFRSAGVNPLGGCIPSLLQIPIFFALYNFFNSNIALRGESFLWSHDLSSYDSIYNIPFTIPFYGDHVSLFTLTAIVSSFVIQIWNMNMTPDQNNPMMKYMPYIFPVILLGVFNGLPSGLTWYYTVSNVITLLIQLVIQKFIIDEKKIHAQLQENRKKPKTKSKWQERMEQVQTTQKKVQDMKDKTKK